jgi:hypothetical protein
MMLAEDRSDRSRAHGRRQFPNGVQ